MPPKMTVTFLCMQCGKYPRLVLWGKERRVCIHCGYKNLMKFLFEDDPELDEEEQDESDG